MKEMDQRPSIFARFARWTEGQLGHPAAFVTACLSIVLWGVTGPLFGWSDTWQLVINTGTTIVTFLMVFVIQNSQNRDMRALQLKLDELIRVNTDARNSLMGLEEKAECEVDEIQKSESAERDLALGQTVDHAEPPRHPQPPTSAKITSRRETRLYTQSSGAAGE
jgi:low affinity Fe/Cu permease